jgi:hypothetical protein
VRGGCEAAAHATRRIIEYLPANHVVVKLDFSNAFNCLDRDHTLQRVAEEAPEIYKFCDQASTLQFGNVTIRSEVGPQQGDPLGGLLFCLGIHPILLVATSDLTIGYMDDITLGGPLHHVSADVELFQAQGSKIGLVLNENKCEVITHDATITESTNLFTRVAPDESSLLGAPLSAGQALTVVNFAGP